MNGYHFTSDTLGNGKAIPPIGEWLEYDPSETIAPGLYASEHPLDALKQAPGAHPVSDPDALKPAPRARLHRVELEGELEAGGNPINRHIGQRRKILASIDATELLWEFARWCALRVIDLWDAPKVVREYLETGDESLQEEAWATARAAREGGEARPTWDIGAAETAEWAAARKKGGPVEQAARKAARSVEWEATARAAREAPAEEWAAAWIGAGAEAEQVQRQKFASMVEVAFAAQANDEQNPTPSPGSRR